MSRPSLLAALLALIASLCAACMPHPDEDQCMKACSFALDSLTSDLSQRAGATPPSGPPDPVSCADACRTQLVPVEYHCLVRSFDADDVQACFDRPRANAYRLDHALNSNPQRRAEHDARKQRLFAADPR